MIYFVRRSILCSSIFIAFDLLYLVKILLTKQELSFLTLLTLLSLLLFCFYFITIICSSNKAFQLLAGVCVKCIFFGFILHHRSSYCYYYCYVSFVAALFLFLLVFYSVDLFIFIYTFLFIFFFFTFICFCCFFHSLLDFIVIVVFSFYLSCLPYKNIRL